MKSDKAMIIYTYRCVDGFVRTRCQRHIESNGPYAMVALVTKREGMAANCVRCMYELWINQLEKEQTDDDWREGRAELAAEEV